MASLSSSSPNILFSSSLASPVRSRSLLSTTKIRPKQMKNESNCNKHRIRYEKAKERLRKTKDAFSEFHHRSILHNISNSPTGKLTLCVLEVMSPKWSDFVLTADIPNSKTYVLVLHCFYIKTYKQKFKIISKNGYRAADKIHAKEPTVDRVIMASRRVAHKLTNCGNRCNNFTKLQLVKDRCFPGSIKTNHKNSHLLLAKEATEQFSKHTSHAESLSLTGNQSKKEEKILANSESKKSPTALKIT